MSQTLAKRIILSPDQLRRLLGRDRELTSATNTARMSALQNAAQTAAAVGPSQAYAQYRSSQERHLNQAAKERDAPLELVVSDPASAVDSTLIPDLIDFDSEVKQPKSRKEGKSPKKKGPRHSAKKTKSYNPGGKRKSGGHKGGERAGPRRVKNTPSITDDEDIGFGLFDTDPDPYQSDTWEDAKSEPVFSPLKTRAARAKAGRDNKENVVSWLRYGRI